MHNHSGTHTPPHPPNLRRVLQHSLTLGNRLLVCRDDRGFFVLAPPFCLHLVCFRTRRTLPSDVGCLSPLLHSANVAALPGMRARDGAVGLMHLL